MKQLEQKEQDVATDWMYKKEREKRRQKEQSMLTQAFGL